jgi:hypothetical protein
MCHHGIFLMDNLHCVLVLLVDTVLVPVLHMSMQDLVERAGLNRIKQFLEAELLLGDGVRDAIGIALLTRSSRHNREAEEGEDEQREAQVLKSRHVARLGIGLCNVQRLLLGISWRCNRGKSSVAGRRDLFDISSMHLVSNQKRGPGGLGLRVMNGAEKVGGPFDAAAQLKSTNERVTVAEPDARRWRGEALRRGRGGGGGRLGVEERKQRSASAGCLRAHVRVGLCLPLVWRWTELCCGGWASTSELRGDVRLTGKLRAGATSSILPSRIPTSQLRGSTISEKPCTYQSTEQRRGDIQLSRFPAPAGNSMGAGKQDSGDVRWREFQRRARLDMSLEETEDVSCTC